jgi:WD40 repeat protein
MRNIGKADDKTARIWDAATGASLATLKGHNGSDSARIVTASWDKTARIWDISALEKGEAYKRQ